MHLRANVPWYESGTDSNNKRQTEEVCHKLILFNSDTEKDDFCGFNAQWEDEDSDQ